MRWILSKVSRAAVSAALSLAHGFKSTPVIEKQHFSSFYVSRVIENRQKEFVPCDFLRWGSIGSFRTSKFASGFTPLQKKPLGSIIDIERVKDRSPEEIVSAWDDVRPPSYMLRNDLVQMPHILFTGLEDYKARGTQAAPYFTVMHYDEFAESKDLVLIRGDIVFSSKLTDSEAKWLLETVHSFYLNDVRYKLVEQFNKETREFEFKDVLKALDMPAI